MKPLCRKNPNNVGLGPCRGGRSRTSMAVATALLVAAGALAGRAEPRPATPVTSGSSFPPPPQPRWNSRTPLPPPPSWASPALVGRFFALSGPMGLPGMLDPNTFQAWMVINGITNPGQQAQLMALLRWYSQSGTGVLPIQSGRGGSAR